MLFDLIIILIFLTILIIGVFKKPLKGLIELGIYLILTILFIEVFYLFLLFLIKMNNIDLNSFYYDISGAVSIVNIELKGIGERIDEELIYFDPLYLNSSYYNKITKAILYSLSLSLSSIFSYFLSILITYLLFKFLKKKSKKDRKESKRRYIYSSIISLISSILIILISVSPYQNVINNYNNFYNNFNKNNINENLGESKNKLNNSSTLYNKTLLKYEEINEGYSSILNEIDSINYNNKIYDNSFKNYLLIYNDYKKIIDEYDNLNIDNESLKEIKNKLEEATKLIKEIENNKINEEEVLSTFIDEININYNKNIKDYFDSSLINLNTINGFIGRIENIYSELDFYLEDFNKIIDKLPSSIYLNKIFSFSFFIDYFIYNDNLTNLSSEVNKFIEELNNIYSCNLDKFNNYFNRLINENNDKLNELNDNYDEFYEKYIEDETNANNIKKYEENYFSSYLTNLNRLDNLLNEIKELINKF